MKTRIISGQEAREKLLAGVNQMADTVGSSLGPRGQNTAIMLMTPKGEVWDRKVIHDGVTIAKNIALEDEAENMSAQIIAEASKKQVDKVGDGTTVTMIIAQAIITESFQIISTGINSMSLRKGLEESGKLLIEELEKLALPVNGLKDMKFVATISAEDTELGEMIAETLEKVGKDGVVTVEESKGPETNVEHQEGMQLDKGYLRDWFVTNPQRMEAILENAYFLLTDKPITTLNSLSNFLNEFVKTSKMLVIISPDISGDALPLLIQNKLEGKLFTLCIPAPSFGEDQKNILSDLAVLTGGKFISQDAGYTFEDLTINDLGFAEYIIATKDETIIRGGRGKKEDIKIRVESIKKSLEEEQSAFDKERLKARLGKLTKGVAVIRVGGNTEIEMKERRERVLDSVAATRAAMEKGIVAGGEVVYLHIRKLLQAREENASITDKILYKALYKPFQKLLSNADLDEIDMALQLSGKGKNWGVDVIDGQVKDLFKAGIIDPVLVPIEAIKNAISVAVSIITTTNIVVPIKEVIKND